MSLGCLCAAKNMRDHSKENIEQHSFFLGIWEIKTGYFGGAFSYLLSVQFVLIHLSPSPKFLIHNTQPLGLFFPLQVK